MFQNVGERKLQSVFQTSTNSRANVVEMSQSKTYRWRQVHHYFCFPEKIRSFAHCTILHRHSLCIMFRSCLLCSCLLRSLLLRHFVLSFSFCCAFLLAQYLAIAQPALSRNDNTRSSRGKDFYLTFLPNLHEQLRDSANTRDSLFIFITSDKPITGRITYRNRTGQVFVRQYALPDPTQIYTFAIAYGGFELLGFNTGGNLTRTIQNETPAPQTFRVEASDEVTVYALNQARYTSDAMLVYPVPALGREYVVMAYNSDGNGRPFFTNPGTDTPSEFAVVATEDNTDITITPRAQTFPPSAILVITTATPSVQNVRLQRGEAYLVQADTRIANGQADLTGSRVVATKPVAVFGGHQRTILPITLQTELGSRDCLLEQMPSVETWGKSVFITPHTQPSQQTAFGTDLYRVMAAYNGTVVALNGVTIATLNAGQFLERQLLDAGWITASDQILVAQFKKSSNPSGGGLAGGGGANFLGDPFMMVIPTVEQYDKGYRFITVRIPDPGVRDGLVFTEHYATIVAPTSGITAIVLDNAPIAPAAFRPIVNSGYSFANIPLAAGVHTARGDSAFGLYVYGYGGANSYGYIGGGKLRIIAPDRDPPRVLLTPECFGVQGIVLDTLVTDSRLERVTAQPTTFANVQLSVERFQAYADSVRFSAALINPYQDGSFTLEAKDSIGFITRRIIPLYGFTVGLAGQGSSRTAPVQRFAIPTGRVRAFPLVLTNYGTTTQTISNVRFLQGGFGMRINRALPIVLPPGASDTLRVSYFALQDGIITDTLLITSTCATRAVAIVSLNAATDRTPPSLTAQADACVRTLTVEVAEVGVLSSGVESLTAQGLVNCTFRIDSASSERVRGRITVVNPRLDAVYTLLARDSSGNVRTITDIIQGFTMELVGVRASAGQFSETAIAGTTNCISISYRNIGLKPFVFDAVAPEGNRTFSIPVSQLPFVIPSGETRSVNVCFAPSELRSFTDTLILSRNCVGDTLVLRGTGISPERIVDSRCAAPIRLRTISVPNTLVILNTAPNPASGQSSLKILLSETAWISISLYAANGTELRHVYDGELESGETSVLVDVSGLEQGVYFYAVQAGAKRVTKQMVIVR
jgi:IgGFc binding protein/Secretion system C-terminal sorting domain